MVILTAGLDLSVGANVALSACLAASVIKVTGSPLLGVATGIGCGAHGRARQRHAGDGAADPVVHRHLRHDVDAHGVTYYYMAGETIHGFPPAFRQLGSGYLFGVPMPVYLMVLFLLIGGLFAQRTIWGQQIYAIGANPVAARLSGVPVERRLVLVYAAERRDGGARLADHSGAHQFGARRHRRGPDAAGRSPRC